MPMACRLRCFWPRPAFLFPNANKTDGVPDPFAPGRCSYGWKPRRGRTDLAPLVIVPPVAHSMGEPDWHGG
ncbi:hypothetical protein GCM10011348_12130 [Marinobacterium nitratireducens]|uniref:Uncharacterized protein n=1 Tax=Marinobacterium nitratireducens TaxID=518897 RepID=A0A917Z9Q6_9GAMM|nr:hypothetical protein GCM10011348_12130 [Marinobacterium nitratireducens]